MPGLGNGAGGHSASSDGLYTGTYAAGDYPFASGGMAQGFGKGGFPASGDAFDQASDESAIREWMAALEGRALFDRTRRRLRGGSGSIRPRHAAIEDVRWPAARKPTRSASKTKASRPLTFKPIRSRSYGWIKSLMGDIKHLPTDSGLTSSIAALSGSFRRLVVGIEVFDEGDLVTALLYRKSFNQSTGEHDAESALAEPQLVADLQMPDRIFVRSGVREVPGIEAGPLVLNDQRH